MIIQIIYRLFIVDYLTKKTLLTFSPTIDVLTQTYSAILIINWNLSKRF